ncbi:hypothetical protein OC842_005038 [Tilletia horrida]|uniref:Uncharacterized protein n=1 Tax=Tilletia horrida TaxID=155126 RepID=A0AAN6G840_9BASI|nr:hypothetical protein OC842_005038 [Tilletia horrida]KAK0559439.1 hypothetical protein OC844_004407 [Tilletia horrida]
MPANPFQFPDTSQLPNPADIPLPPPGITTTAAIRQPLVFVVLYTALASPLIVLLILLLISPISSRTWAYRLNVIILVLGIALAACNDAAEIIGMFAPLKLNIRLLVATAAFNQLVPWIADCVLLLRVAAVYPARTVSKRVRAVLLGIPILFKIGRLICISLFAHYFVTKGEELGPLLVLKALIPSPYMYAEAILQTCDNGFCSILFLRKLNRQQNLLRPVGSTKTLSPESTFSRIRRLFIAALSSFLLPCLMNIIILIVSPLRPYDEPITIVIAVNAYVTIYSLLFATVWVPTGDPLATGSSHAGSGLTFSGDGVLRDRCTYCSSVRRMSKSHHTHNGPTTTKAGSLAHRPSNANDLEVLDFAGANKSPTTNRSLFQSDYSMAPPGSATGAQQGQGQGQGAGAGAGAGNNTIEMRRIPGRHKSTLTSIRIDDGKADSDSEFSLSHSHGLGLGMGLSGKDFALPPHETSIYGDREIVDEEKATWSLSSATAAGEDSSPPSGSGILSPASTLGGNSNGFITTSGAGAGREGVSPTRRPSIESSSGGIQSQTQTQTQTQTQSAPSLAQQRYQPSPSNGPTAAAAAQQQQQQQQQHYFLSPGTAHPGPPRDGVRIQIERESFADSP